MSKTTTYTYDDPRTTSLMVKGKRGQRISYAAGALVTDPDHIEALKAAGYKMAEGEVRQSPVAEVVSRDGKPPKSGK